MIDREEAIKSYCDSLKLDVEDFKKQIFEQIEKTEENLKEVLKSE